MEKVEAGPMRDLTGLKNVKESMSAILKQNKVARKSMCSVGLTSP